MWDSQSISTFSSGKAGPDVTTQLYLVELLSFVCKAEERDMATTADQALLNNSASLRLRRYQIVGQTC